MFDFARLSRGDMSIGGGIMEHRATKRNGCDPNQVHDTGSEGPGCARARPSGSRLPRPMSIPQVLLTAFDLLGGGPATPGRLIACGLDVLVGVLQQTHARGRGKVP